MMKKRSRSRNSFSYRLIIAALVFFAVLCVIPFWYVMVTSFSDPQLVKEGQFRILPTGYSLQAYEMLFRDQRFFSGLGITVFRTVVVQACSYWYRRLWLTHLRNGFCPDRRC